MEIITMKNHQAMPRTYWQRISSLRVSKETPDGIIGECIEFPDQRMAYNAQIVACQHDCKVAVRKITKPTGPAWALWLIIKPDKKTTFKKVTITTKEGAK